MDRSCELKIFVEPTFGRLEKVLMSTELFALKYVLAEVVIKCCNASRGVQILNLVSVLYLSHLSS